jgi:hypothetical protein
LPTTETCSWAGHGFGKCHWRHTSCTANASTGAACTADNYCSDDDVCDPTGGICVDPYAVDQYPPFFVTFTCVNDTYSTTGPDCGHAHKVTCPPGGSVTASVLEIQGEYFNTGDVDIQVLSNGTAVYSASVTAVAGNPGLLGGSFSVKTYALCPSKAYPYFIQFTDSCTGKVFGFNYPN